MKSISMQLDKVVDLSHSEDISVNAPKKHYKLSMHDIDKDSSFPKPISTKHLTERENL